MKKLTQKQEMFCLAYIETGNASEAYRRSYNAKNMGINTIKVKASNLMSKDNIRVTVKNLQDELKEKAIVTTEEVINRLNTLSKDSDREEVQLKATIELGKHLGIYEKDNHQKAPVQQINNFNNFYEEEDE